MDDAFTREPRWDPRSFPPAVRTPRLVQTARMLADPQGYGCSLRRRLGPVFALRVFPYRGALVCAADAATNREVLTDDERFFGGDAASLLAPAVGTGSLICTPPPRHLRNRKLLFPPFHGKRIALWAERVAELADAGLPGLLAAGDVAVRPWAQKLTLDVILHVIFGLSDPARLAMFREALNPFVAPGNVIMLSLPKAAQRDLGPFSPGGRFFRLRARVDTLLYDEIAARRAGTDFAERDDILSLLLSVRDEYGAGLSDEHLRDELAGLVLAGYETTATTIAWALHLLAHHPLVRDKLIADLDDGSDELLKATVNEVMRLRPAVSYAARTAAHDTELGGHPVPANAFVLALFSVTHLDPGLWPEPEAFKPERHLRAAARPYSWTPFGGGVRRCIGMSLAQLEIEIVLKKVLAVAVPEPAGPVESSRLSSVTIIPVRGGRVRLRRRRVGTSRAGLG